jgi:hypothetical protein
LKLRAKNGRNNKSSRSKANSSGQQASKANKKASDYDEDDDDSDSDSDEDSDEDETESDENNAAAASKQADSAANRLRSPFISTTSVNDPVLVTHAKCLAEDILCSWKRRLAQKQSKELWIFWFEKEEPPNLKALISRDLIVDQSNQTHQTETQQNPTTSGGGGGGNILSHAMSSHNGMPYECRSMLFKALHNLIERSLLEKGYARLGKWFVMPYNLQAVNYSIYGGGMLNNLVVGAGSNGGGCGVAAVSSSSSTTLVTSNENNNTQSSASQQPLTPTLSTQQSPATPQPVAPKVCVCFFVNYWVLNIFNFFNKNKVEIFFFNFSKKLK